MYKQRSISVSAVLAGLAIISEDSIKVQVRQSVVIR